MSVGTDVKADVQREMKRILEEFVPVLRSWTMEHTNRMIDPFETVYSENYAPANAAVIYASVYRCFGNPEVLDNCLSMVRRSTELLRQPKDVSPFCRVFLFHYSMAALLLLPEEVQHSVKGEFAAFYAAYEDDCLQLNTNCAALQWGMEIYLEALGFRKAEPGKLEHLIGWVERSQSEGGFINDELTWRGEQDGMPIAYHAFTLFILFSTVAVTEHWPEALKPHWEKAMDIISRGIKWLMHSATEDGTFAMIERSSHQMFTWGIYAALLSGTNLADSALFRQAWEYWLDFRHPDGSYSCTPNWLPHELRTGFETYTHVNMYNNLALSGIAVSLRVLESPERVRTHLPLLQVPGSERYMDLSGGYAFFRTGNHYFACTLRMHNRKYAPAMQGFHYRFGDRKLPLAEPKIKEVQAADQRQYLTEGVWEGFLLKDDSGRLYYADSDHNVHADFLEDGIRFDWDTAHFRCRKEILVKERGFSWKYEMMLKQDFKSCIHVLPILLHDGRNGTKVIERSSGRMDIMYRGIGFTLTNSQSDKIGTLLNRTLLSVSGIATSAHIAISGPYTAGTTVGWETAIQLQEMEE